MKTPLFSILACATLFGLLVVSGSGSSVHAEVSTSADALAAIDELGGSARPLSSNPSDGWEVEFHLRGNDLNDAGLARVAALDNIVSLNLRDTKITGGGLAHLKGLSQLRSLHLERTAVDDAGVAHLAGLANLEYLNLYSTNITDESLTSLAGLANLRRLYVWQTGVTDDGVARLEKQIPKLKISRGVDLSKLPTYTDETEEPKPTTALKWIATSDRADAPKSVQGVNTQVFFENASKKRVKLYWISYGNELTLYAQLEPGGTRQQNSYSRNTWLIADENDKPLGYFVVGTEVAKAVIPSQ